MGKQTAERREEINKNTVIREFTELHHVPIASLQKSKYKTQVLGELHRDRGGKHDMCGDDPQKTEHRTTGKETAWAVTMTQGQVCQAKQDPR